MSLRRFVHVYSVPRTLRGDDCSGFFDFDTPEVRRFNGKSLLLELEHRRLGEKDGNSRLSIPPCPPKMLNPFVKAMRYTELDATAEIWDVEALDQFSLVSIAACTLLLRDDYHSCNLSCA